MRSLGAIAALALSLWAGTPASAAWLEARSPHFIVYSEGKPEAIREFADRLERFDMGMRQLHKLPDTEEERSNPLTVYMLDNASALQRLCAQGRKQGCTNVYGFYEGRAEGSVAFMPRRVQVNSKFDLTALTVLLHEYSHHILLAKYSAAYPAWFVEGFAEFNGSAEFNDDGTVGFGTIAKHRLVSLVLGIRLPMEKLLTANPSQLDPKRLEMMYARGWLLTHFLTFEKPRAGQLAAYLAAMNAGKSNLEAAKAAFGDLTVLDKELDAYLNRRSMSYWRLPVQSIAQDAIRVRALSAGEAATMPVRMRSDRGVDDVTAPEVLKDARKLAAPFANDPGAQNAVAEAAYDAGNDDEAEAAADRALASAPTDRTAMLYKGRAMVRRAQRANETDIKVWNRARNWFVKANRQDPNDATPLYLFYKSFLDQGIVPTANAAIGLKRAFELAPQDDGLRYMLAQQLIRDQEIKEARAVLAPLAFNPHADPANPAAALIALIDKGDAAGARAALTATSRAAAER